MNPRHSPRPMPKDCSLCGRMENMTYDPEQDHYVCFNGKKIIWKYDRKEKTATGYLSAPAVIKTTVEVPLQ